VNERTKQMILALLISALIIAGVTLSFMAGIWYAIEHESALSDEMHDMERQLDALCVPGDST
jgi:hypothetical protein